MDVESMIERPVFICGASRSGTTFLMNLLDGHPNLMVFSSEVAFLEWHRKRSRYSPDIFINKFIDQMPQSYYWNPVDLSRFNNYLFTKYGPCTELKFGNHDFSKFKSIFKNNLDDVPTLKNIISSWAKAFFYSNENYWPDYDPHYFVTKEPLCNEIGAGELKKEFPQAKFIHVIRNPIGRYASAKKRRISTLAIIRLFNRWLYNRNMFPGLCKFFKSDYFKYMEHFISDIDFVTAICAQIATTMKLALENQERIGKDSYLIVKYEDMITCREKKMQEIAKFLGIPESQFILYPTQHRIPVAANSSFWESGNKTKGINPCLADENRFRELTSPSERALFNYYLFDICNKFSYSVPFVDVKMLLKCIYMPYKYETSRHYLLRRFKAVKIIKELKNRPLDAIWLDRWRSGDLI